MKRALAVAIVLTPTIFASAQSREVAGRSPKEVVREFVIMELGGSRLTPEGRLRTVPLLMRPITAPPSTVDIVSDNIDVQEAPGAENRVNSDVYFRYFYGWLDASLRFTPAPHVASGNGLLKEGINAAYALVPADGAWRIENPPSFTMISLATATRYVTEARNNTADPAIKKNALDTLAKLKKLPPK
jgi:hypothetical protein